MTDISLADGELVQAHSDLIVDTQGTEFVEITSNISHWLREINCKDGLLTMFVCHTSASLTIQKNADPDVCADLLDGLDRLAPQNMVYRHSLEGPEDMPAHTRSMITSVILVFQFVLGRWCWRFGKEYT